MAISPASMKSESGVNDSYQPEPLNLGEKLLTKSIFSPIEEAHKRNSVEKRRAAMRLSQSQLYGKENSSERGAVPKTNNQCERKVLGDLRLESSGRLRATKISRTSEQKKARRSSKMFRVYCSDDDREEKVSAGFPVVSAESEEPFFDAESCIPVEPKRESDSYDSDENEKTWEEQTAQLISIFPDIDPSFLKAECKRLRAPLGVVTESVLSKKKQAPTRDYNAKEKTEMDYMNRFTVEKLLKFIPDPWSYFEDRTRECYRFAGHSLHYLKVKFKRHYAQTISDALVFHNNNLYLAYKYLTKKNRGLRLRTANRSMSECNANKPSTISTEFLLEMAFIENEEEVRNQFKHQAGAKRQRWREAQKLGTLLSCGCCLEESLLAEDIVQCSSNHVFCKKCVARFIEIKITNGDIQFKCLDACNEVYTLDIIQGISNQKTFTTLVKSILSSGNSFPGAENLVECPFCHYVSVIPPEEKVVVCSNVYCLVESCRFCRCEANPNHNCKSEEDTIHTIQSNETSSQELEKSACGAFTVDDPAF